MLWEYSGNDDVKYCDCSSRAADELDCGYFVNVVQGRNFFVGITGAKIVTSLQELLKEKVIHHYASKTTMEEIRLLHCF